MFNVIKSSIEWGGEQLTLETGKVARQADGAVMVTFGETTVMAVVTAAKDANPDLDFFPLTVNYQEKAYAAGRIPGGFFKREGKASEREVLISRLIDRPIRPLFHEKFKNETQVVCTVLSHDGINDPEIAAMIGVSAALTISGVPFLGPIAASRVGFINGEYILNPNKEQLDLGRLDLMVAGTQDSVLMVESEASQLTEKEMLGAVKFGHDQMQSVINLIIDFAEHAAKDAWDLPKSDDISDLQQNIANECQNNIIEAYKIISKQDRVNRLAEIRSEISDKYEEEYGKTAVSGIVKSLEQEIVRGAILKGEKRIDGRSNADIRNIECEVGIIPKLHGSALFTRGETQALVVTTLGTGEDEQIIDNITGDYREHFMLHYNFPAYSVGEVAPLRAPGRREIGHGKLAWRALSSVMPEKEAFPYTIRIVSEITESNGSSSMATVCGSSMAMMDAGVPLPAPVAGIAMGLIKDGEDYAILSDIMGDEDHLGDMDFKVAGTKEGVTALQMDIKIRGITTEIMEKALDQARDGLNHILGEMNKAIEESRTQVNANAPAIDIIKINKNKIRDVIGSGGKVIRDICDKTTAKIDISDDGVVRIAAIGQEKIAMARQMIEDIITEPEVGKIYNGKVVRVVDFGAFVRFMGTTEGLLHISELADHHVEKVTDVIKEGDEIKVKLIAIDNRGKIRLSYKAANNSNDDNNENQEDRQTARA